MHQYPATLLEVLDGDTVKLEVDLGFHVRIRETFRLARINCPPLLSLRGVQAKEFTAQHLAQATAVMVETKRAEKYGRWLAELFIQTPETGADWTNLNSLLLKSGHANPYRP